MIGRRSFITGLIALVAAPLGKSEMEWCELQPPKAVYYGALTNEGRVLLENLMFRTADFPLADRISARLARAIADDNAQLS